MVLLKKIRENLLIFIKDNIVIFNPRDSSRRNLKIPAIVLPNLTKSLKEVLKEENKIITSVCVSKNEDYVAVTLQNRQLVIYDADFNVLHNILTKRSVSKVRFFDHDKKVLVADKTGEVYLYDFEQEPRLLLGHLSMLLDIVMSKCEKYIITSDRDEKIRVSCYPNAYNIKSYCLGHKEFVNKMEMYGEILLTGSGDGTVRFWNFLNGQQLHLLNTNDYVKDRGAIQRFASVMDGEHVEVCALPISDLQVYKNTIAVTLLGFDGILLYRIDIINEQLDVKFLENVLVKEEVMSFCLSDDLFVLSKKFELNIFNISTKDGYKSTHMADLSDLCDCFETDTKDFNFPNSITTLYKRKFDNVQEYLERKKLRLDNK